MRVLSRSRRWADEITALRIGVGRSGFDTTSGEHDICEHQRSGMQRSNKRRGVNCGDVPDTSAHGLGLNIQVRFSGVARVSYVGNSLATPDLITNFDPDAAWAEMAEHEKASATNVEDDVIAALEAAVCRSDCWSGRPSSTKATVPSAGASTGFP
jgi:hypothetical protein